MSLQDIYARAPVNSTAARVTSEGYKYKPCKVVVTNDSELPIATMPITEDFRKNPSFVDLTGKVFGRFVVLGRARDYAGHWVVKCRCGRYSTRRSKAINNPNNNGDRCAHCLHLAHLKRHSDWKTYGVNWKASNEY